MTILVTMTFENAEDVSAAMARLATTAQFAAQQGCGNPTVAADAARLHLLLDDHPHPGMRAEVRELLGDLHEYSYASACRAIDAIACRLVPPPPAGVLSKDEWAVEAFRLLANAPAIDPADRPDAGFPLPPVAPPAAPALPVSLDPAEVFGGPPALPALPALPPVPAPPVAASSLPSAATAPTGAPAAVDLDKDGMPWDARLHAGTRTKNADGTWRALRKPAAPKVDVEADLKAGLAAPPATVPPPPGAVGENFAQYMARIGPLFAADAGKATAAMAAALAPCKLAHIGQLAARADLIPEVDTRFQAGMAA